MESAYRYTGLLFITARISHLATERSVARSRRIESIETSLENTKTVLFHRRTASIFYISVFKAVQTVHVQGRLNNDVIVREYSAIGYFSNLSNVSLRTPGQIQLLPRKYIVTFMLFTWMTEHLRFSYIASLISFIVIRNAWITHDYRKSKLWEKKIPSKISRLKKILKCIPYEDKMFLN